jgi:hypothetical protein
LHTASDLPGRDTLGLPGLGLVLLIALALQQSVLTVPASLTFAGNLLPKVQRPQPAAR